MAVKMDDFLLEYYRRLIFRDMSPERFAQYCKYVDASDFKGNMKSWSQELLEKDADGNLIKDAGKQYVRKSMPDPTQPGGEYELSDEEWEKLFKAFQKGFRSMAGSKKKFKYKNKAVDFLDKYFGDGKLFNNAVADYSAETKIQELKNLLTAHPRLEYALRQAGYINDDFTIKDLFDGIDSKKYNSNPDFKDRLVNVAGYIDYLPQEKPQLAATIGQTDFGAIDKGFEDTRISPARMLEFKQVYPELLNKLYTSSDVFDAFSAYGNSKITDILTDAKGRVNYADKEGDSYVPEKRDDELNPWQQMTKWWGDTYDEYFDKYVKFHGDRMFFSPSAGLIVKAINDLKIKPTDGLDKIKDELGKITAKFETKSVTAVKHLKWFVDQMDELKRQNPKAFAGALQDGRQMRKIVETLAAIAIKTDKLAEVKTALEVLSVIKYSYTTSKIMETFKSSTANGKFSIFSDKGASWNKNQAMQFLTTALDKTLRTALLGVGYGLTMAGNAYKLSGSKFRGKSKALATAASAWDEKDTKSKQSMADEIATYERQLATEQARKQHLESMGINADVMPQRQEQLDKQQKALDPLREELADIDNKIQITNARLQRATGGATSLFGRPLFDDYYDDEPKQTPEQLKKRLEELTKLKETKERELETRSASSDELYQQIYDYNETVENIKYLESLIDDRRDKLEKWSDDHNNQFDDLMQFWNFLNTGRNLHGGAFYSWKLGKRATAQEKFDATKDDLFKQYKEQHSHLY